MDGAHAQAGKGHGGPRDAAIYVRVSTVGQEEDGSSLATQEDRCRRYAADHGFLVGEAQIYREVYTGTELWDRPQLTRLREAMRHRAMGVVVAYAIDRLSRDPVHLGVIISEAEHYGVEVAFVTEPLDNTPEGQLVRFVRGYAAKVEAEKIRERSLRGKRARVESGKLPNYGAELYGYRREKLAGIRHVYEPEATVIREIFHWLMSERLSIRAVVRRLNERGYPPPSASKMTSPDLHPQWGKGQLHRILKNPAYKGTSVAWRYTHGGHIRPQTEWMALPDGVTPPIVPPSLWEQVQARLATNRGEDTRNHARTYLLRGRIVCAVCTRAMRSCPEPHGLRTYRCASRETPSGACGGKRVRADDVERWVWEQVLRILRDPEIIAAELRRRREEGPDPTLLANRDAAQRRFVTLEKQQAKLLRSFREAEEDLVPWELIKRELAHIEQEKAQVQAALTDLQQRLAEQQAAIVQLDTLTAYCQRVAQQLSTFGFEEQRLALEALGVKVVANGREWGIEGNIPLEGV